MRPFSTRLRASVQLRVKTTRSGLGALNSRQTVLPRVFDELLRRHRQPVRRAARIAGRARASRCDRAVHLLGLGPRGRRVVEIDGTRSAADVLAIQAQGLASRRMSRRHGAAVAKHDHVAIVDAEPHQVPVVLELEAAAERLAQEVEIELERRRRQRPARPCVRTATSSSGARRRSSSAKVGA